MTIPDLHAGWEAIREAVRKGQVNEAEQLLAQFERQCRASPDLIVSDARRLAAAARERFGQATGETKVAAAAPGDRLGDLASLGLYRRP